MTTKSSKKNKRSNTKYPGLDKRLHLKVRQELIDQDYINQLSEKEKAWLSNFNEEYIAGKFDHPGKVLHKTKKLKKDCYDKNNARNRDVYSITKANDMLKDESELVTILESERSTNNAEIEDVLIERIDASNLEIE